jgi:ATP-dependent DNA ligase
MLDAVLSSGLCPRHQRIGYTLTINSFRACATPWKKSLDNWGLFQCICVMKKRTEFCLPTAGKAVPDGPDWIHEVKYDGYREACRA